MRSVRQYILEDQVIQILTGLNDQFSVVKTQVLLMECLPSINKVYSLVEQEESNCSVIPVVDDVTLANAYDSKKIYGRGK